LTQIIATADAMQSTPSETREPASPGAADAPSTKRRLATQHVREARDRLTSTSGTRPVFDYELLRQFAQNRLSGSLVILLLVLTIGLLSALWTGALTSGVWTAATLIIHAVIIHACRQFLNEQPATMNLRSWRLRFILLDLFFGVAWTFILIQPLGTDEQSGTFMLFVMLLVVAISSMLASSLPIAVLALTLPVTIAIALDFVLRGTLHYYILAVMTLAAEGYFSRVPALFDHARHARSAGRKGRADRRARAIEVDLGRSTAARGSRQHRQVALPRADEP
jgi:two-component system, cell cycle sensor histidine kinase PleC